MLLVTDHLFFKMLTGNSFIVILGTVESNPMSSGAVCLSFHFNDYNTNCPIYYPPFEQVCICLCESILPLHGMCVNHSKYSIVPISKR